MNETVKAVLLSQRQNALHGVKNCQLDLARIRDDLATTEMTLASKRARLNDIELHLRDNGVDLAAVDAEAERARVQRALQTGLAGSYGQTRSDLGGMLGVNRANTFDPTAGLAKALDEA